MVKYLELIDRLGLPKQKCLIFGSAVLAAHGLRENNDLDLVVPLDVFSSLAHKPDFKVGYASSSGTKMYTIEGGKLEIFPTAWPLKEPVGVLLQRADTIDGYKFMHLSDFKRWKQLRGLAKDIADLKLL
jgi:hypothetical protein